MLPFKHQTKRFMYLVFVVRTEKDPRHVDLMYLSLLLTTHKAFVDNVDQDQTAWKVQSNL